MNDQGPWLKELPKLSHIEIAARIEKIEPLSIDLSSEESEIASKTLEAAFEETVVATDRMVDMLDQLYRAFRAWNAVRFPSTRHYYAALNSGLFGGPFSPICFTGLAGAGKSALLKSLDCLICYQSKYFGPEDGIPVPLKAYVYLPVKSKGTRARLLSMAYKLVIGRTDLTAKEILKVIPLEEEAYRRGVSAIALDELQFLTRSAEATAAISAALLAFYDSNVPFVYGCNFSLLHKLRTRDHEDRDRLLADIRILGPYQAAERGWHRLLTTLLNLAPESYSVDVPAHAETLCEMTGGMGRALRKLLVKSYVRARERGATRVSIDDVVATYRGHSYATMRIDIETIRRHRVTRTPGPPDLVLPPEYWDSEEMQEVEAVARIRQQAIDMGQVIQRALTAQERVRLNRDDRVMPAVLKKSSRRAGASLPSEEQLRDGMKYVLGMRKRRE